MKNWSKKEVENVEVNAKISGDVARVEEKPSYAMMAKSDGQIEGLQSDDTISSDESLESIPEKTNNPENNFEWPFWCGNIDQLDDFDCPGVGFPLVGKVMKYEMGKMIFLVSFYESMKKQININDLFRDELGGEYIFQDQNEIPNGSWIMADKLWVKSLTS